MISLALATTILALTSWAADGAAGMNPSDRAQLHRNTNRGIAYLPLAQQGAGAGAVSLTMKAIQTIELDGDGDLELVQYNGFRFMQVWDRSGNKLWRVENPDGRTHDYVDAVHRDPIVVTDLDGDGKQDIAHCWISNGQRQLVYRRGLDGAVIAATAIQGAVTTDCQIAAFRVAEQEPPLILVAFPLWGAGSSSCSYNFIESWAKTVAFDVRQQRLWERITCNAGHYTWPLDENADGVAEAFFVGKYLLRPDGSLQCTLGTWPAADHVDSLAVADLDLSRPGLEAVAVGATGTAMFSAATCQQVWRIATTTVRNPQHVMVAQLDSSAATPQIVIDERGSETNARTYVLNGQGVVLAAGASVMAMQNANLDGALGIDEAVGNFGMVLDRFANVRLNRWWYWSMKGGKVVETNAGPYPNLYDRWQAFPLIVDWDGDGREELITWGQSLIVIGKVK